MIFTINDPKVYRWQVSIRCATLQIVRSKQQNEMSSDMDVRRIEPDGLQIRKFSFTFIQREENDKMQFAIGSLRSTNENKRRKMCHVNKIYIQFSDPDQMKIEPFHLNDFQLYCDECHAPDSHIPSNGEWCQAQQTFATILSEAERKKKEEENKIKLSHLIE